MHPLYFLQTLIGSFYNPQVYRDAVKVKKENTFAYLLFLVLICVIPVTIKIISAADNFLKNDGTYFANQVPQLTLKNGIVTMDKESPYFIRSKTGEILIAIDLSDSALNTGSKVYGHMLLTKNKLYTNDGGKSQAHDLSAVKSFSLNSRKILSWFSHAWVFYIISFIFMVALLFAYRIVQAAFNTVIGLIISIILKIKLEFISLMYITMVAITPVAVIAAVLWVTDITIPVKGWLGFFLALVYISFGIIANKPLASNANFGNPVDNNPDERNSL